MDRGRPLRENDNQTLVAGWMMAQNLKLKPGDTLDVSGRTFKVVGVLKRGNHPFDMLGYIPLKTAQRIREQPGKICAVVAQIKSPRDVAPVKARIKAMFPKVDVQDVEQIAERAKGMMVLTQAVHFAVSCFALFIGVLFVATTMIMSVSERVRELATLRVIGASRGYITKMIMAESLCLSLLGGALGCGLGYLLSKGIDHLIRLSMGETFMRTFVSPKIFLIALAISLLTGTFAGLLPVRMIMKKQLAESLRYE
jgi:putative ABC transport system permease protein